MKLESIKYFQFKGTSNEWSLFHTNFGQINLMVGKNASGKTRTVHIISNLARLLSGKIKPTFLSSDYSVIFRNDDNKEIKYRLVISDRKVEKEELIVDGKKLLNRNKGGKGYIYTTQFRKPIKFQTPDTELTSSTRRDSLQHPFFESLYNWSSNINLYLFGTPLGQDTVLLPSDDKSNDPKARELEGVIRIYKIGEEKFGTNFKKQVIKDMASVGYKLEAINVGRPTNITSSLDLLSLVIKEEGIDAPINQTEISQGMFRALSLIIQINYYSFLDKSSCIVIDDIGEGLDFDRSTKLIQLIISKAEKSKVQLIMSTNDRFVMNNVPLKYWSIIQRKDQGSKIYNYQNSKKVFDEFEFTGLNNFDFYSKKFFE